MLLLLFAGQKQLNTVKFGFCPENGGRIFFGNIVNHKLNYSFS